MTSGHAFRSLFEAIGGPAVIPALVEDLYQRVLADPVVAPFFDDVSVADVMAHQASFLSDVLDPAIGYSGRTMADAHGHLAIEDRHFDHVVQHLTEALRALAVPEPLVSEAVVRLSRLRPEIVSVRPGSR
jgi:hemoglobin